MHPAKFIIDTRPDRCDAEQDRQWLCFALSARLRIARLHPREVIGSTWDEIVYCLEIERSHRHKGEVRS